MNISELIEELEKIKNFRGDIPVWVLNQDWNTLCSLEVMYNQRLDAVEIRVEQNK